MEWVATWEEAAEVETAEARTWHPAAAVVVVALSLAVQALPPAVALLVLVGWIR